MANEYKLSFKAADINKKLSIISTPSTAIPGEIKTKFSDTDWDTIAWVAKNDDPSKYWKVGDYKNITIPAKVSYTWYITYIGHSSLNYGEVPMYFWDIDNANTKPGEDDRPYTSTVATLKLIDRYKFSEKFYNTLNAIGLDTPYQQGTSLYISPAILVYGQDDCITQNQIGVSIRVFESKDDEGIVPALSIANFTTTINLTDNNDTIESNIRQAFSNWGLGFESTYTDFIQEGLRQGFPIRVYNPSNHFTCTFANSTSENMRITIPAKTYPCTILGFNHDDVADPWTYGKSKAGMTLCLGVSRGNYKGNIPPSDWVNTLSTNLYESDLSSFNAITSDSLFLKSPYRAGGIEYWADDIDEPLPHTQFYDALQEILKGSELDPLDPQKPTKLVQVLKTTAAGPYQLNQNYVPSVLSADKISLLSENEVQGKIYYAAVQEGQQYEFFKRGYSKFFWNSLMLGTNPKSVSIDLLSRSRVARASISGPDYNKATMKSDKNSCCIRSRATLLYRHIGDSDDEGTATAESSIATITPDLFVRNAVVDYPIGTFEAIITPNGGNYDVLIRKETSPGTFSNVIKLENESKTTFQNNYGIKIKEIGTTVFSIERGTQVSYEPSNTSLSGNSTGVLLPIFCL